MKTFRVTCTDKVWEVRADYYIVEQGNLVFLTRDGSNPISGGRHEIARLPKQPGVRERGFAEFGAGHWIDVEPRISQVARALSGAWRAGV